MESSLVNARIELLFLIRRDIQQGFNDSHDR